MSSSSRFARSRKSLASARGRLRMVAKTFAPARAYSSAPIRPNPVEQPVIRMDLPDKSSFASTRCGRALDEPATSAPVAAAPARRVLRLIFGMVWGSFCKCRKRRLRVKAWMALSCQRLCQKCPADAFLFVSTIKQTHHRAYGQPSRSAGCLSPRISNQKLRR